MGLEYSERLERVVRYPEINGAILAIAVAPGWPDLESRFREDLKGTDVPVTVEPTLDARTYMLTFDALNGERRYRIYDENGPIAHDPDPVDGTERA